MKIFHQTLEEYLTVRRALGFKFTEGAELLPSFIDYLEYHRAPTVTTALALAWSKQPPDAHPGWWAKKLGYVRGFAKYLQTLDARTEVPPVGLLPHCSQRTTPYLYADRDIARLMAAAQRLRPPLMAATYTTLIGLLATTGMRGGEAIGLGRHDVSKSRRLLVVRNGKFGKSREVVLHDTTVAALHTYARLRNRQIPKPNASTFFVSTVGTPLIRQRVGNVFGRLVRSVGLEPRSGRCRPRLHDLRHTFATRALERWYREGVDVQTKLPLLSTYLGHVNPSSTYWYLSAVPELMTLAAQRLENAREVTP